jgi:hypothetical protein
MKVETAGQKPKAPTPTTEIKATSRFLRIFARSLGEGFYGDELRYHLEQVISETNPFILKDTFVS